MIYTIDAHGGAVVALEVSEESARLTGLSPDELIASDVRSGPS